MTTLYVSTDKDGREYKGGQVLSPGVEIERPGEEYPDEKYKDIPCSWNVGLKHLEVVPYMLPFFQNDPWDIETGHSRIWKCEGSGKIHDDGLRVCATTIKVVEEVTFSRPSVTQCKAFAVICGLSLYHHPEFQTWAKLWLAKNETAVADADKLLDRLYQEEQFDIPGRPVANSALACVLAESGGDPQKSSTRLLSAEYFSAAAGWNLHTISDGRLSLLPAITFAAEFVVDNQKTEGTISGVPKSPESSTDEQTQSA